MMANSQVGVVYAYLRGGRPLTQAGAWRMYRISRLASVIEDLRKAGRRIDTELIEKRTRYGKTRYARYRMARYGRC